MKFKTNKEILVLLGQKLKKIRLNENYTQQQVADHIGIDRVTLSLIENGKNTTLINFIKLIKFYNKTEELLNVLYSPKYNVMEMLKIEKSQRHRASSGGGPPGNPGFLNQ